MPDVQKEEWTLNKYMGKKGYNMNVDNPEALKQIEKAVQENPTAREQIEKEFSRIINTEGPDIDKQEKHMWNSEEERKENHLNKFGTDKLPPRGTGLEDSGGPGSGKKGHKTFNPEDQKQMRTKKPEEPMISGPETKKAIDKTKQWSKNADDKINKDLDSGKTQKKKIDGITKVVPTQGTNVEHPRFGKGKITNIDATTYSVPMATVKLDNGDEIVRGLSEWKSQEPEGSNKTGAQLFEESVAAFQVKQKEMDEMNEEQEKIKKEKEAKKQIHSEQPQSTINKQEANDKKNLKVVS